MIHLTNIGKHYGSKVLYSGGSIQINPGDKIGLVGPNGAGKTTIFRIIMKEEGVDEGAISIADRVTIGYFSQTVAEMSGRSALDEVKAGAGKVSELSAKLGEMERQLENAAELSDDEMQKLLEKYGETQARYEEMGGYN